MLSLLHTLKDVFSKEMLIDPRTRDFDGNAYQSSCRQRCATIVGRTTTIIKEVDVLIQQNSVLKSEQDFFAQLADSVLSNLKNSSDKLHTILGDANLGEKEQQLKCYGLGMTVQQSTRALIDAYLSSFGKRCDDLRNR